MIDSETDKSNNNYSLKNVCEAIKTLHDIDSNTAQKLEKALRIEVGISYVLQGDKHDTELRSFIKKCAKDKDIKSLTLGYGGTFGDQNPYDGADKVVSSTLIYEVLGQELGDQIVSIIG